MPGIVERLAILVDLDGSKAVAEMQKVGRSAERDLGKASDASKKVGTGMMVAGAGMVAAGTLITRTLGKMGDDFVSAGKDTLKLQRMTGETAETMSRMRFAAQQSGVDVDTLAKGYSMLTKSMAAGKPAFDGLGVSIKDSSGHLRGANDVFLEVADRLKAMSNESERNALANQIFGRSYADLLPLLNKGGAEIQRLAAEADKYGLTLTGENLDAVKANIKAHRELDATMAGLRVQIGGGVISAMNTMLGPVKSLVSVVGQLPGPVRSTIGSLGMFGGTALIFAGGASMMIGAVIRMKSNFVEAAAAARNFFSGMSRGEMALRGFSVAGAIAALGLLQKKLSDNADAADHWLQTQTRAFAGTVPEQIEDTKRIIAGLQGELDSMTTLDFGGAQGEGGVHFAWSSETLDKMTSAKKHLADLEGQMQQQGNSADLAARGVDEYGNALENAEQKTKDLQKAQDELWAQLTGQFDAGQQVASTWDRVNEGLGRLIELQRQGKAGSAEYGQALRGVAADMEANARAQAENYVAQVTANGGTVDAWQKTLIYRNALTDLAAQYPGVRNELQQTIALANRTVLTQFLLQVGWAGDSLAVKTAQAVAAGDQRAAIKATMDAVGIPTQFRPPEYRAKGGRASAGSPYVVGEQRPELFVPDNSGTIMPTTGGITVHVHGVVGDHKAVAAAILDEIRREGFATVGSDS